MSFQRQSRPGKARSPQNRGVVAIAVLCLALLAMLSVAQAVHTHENPTAADHCPLCITMHTVVPTAVAVIALILVQVAQAPLVLGVQVASRQRLPQLFIRPPPVFC
ncbi:MAG: hypothetical protein WBD67_01120 [Terracidiphilus sp.]